MLLIVKSKLITNVDQHNSLLKTMEKFNEACNFISIFAFKKRTFGKVGIQKELYYVIREKYGLSAQMTVRAVGKVAESYKVDKKHFMNLILMELLSTIKEFCPIKRLMLFLY